MSTPQPPPPPPPPPAYTVTKLLRWRVKVLVSCFYTCNFPLEEETESNNRQVPRETAIMKSKVGKKTKQKEAKSSSSSSRLIRRRRVVAENKEIGGDDEALPSFGDDDFIVFCFRDDGEVQVVLPETNTTSNPILSTHDHFQTLRLENEAVGNEKACNRKVQGKEASIREKTEEEGSGEDKEISTASSDSNDQSDASTASFAFPIIQEKWIGSPVEMPRSGVRRPKINTRIHCCRF